MVQSTEGFALIMTVSVSPEDFPSGLGLHGKPSQWHKQDGSN